MTLDELNKVVRDLVNIVMTIPDVIPHFDNGPVPAAEFASVNIATVTRANMSDKKLATSGEDLSQKVIMLHDALISVNFYRSNARQNASILSGSMQMNKATEFLNSVGVGFTGVSPVRDLTHLEATVYEERAQIDLTLQFELTGIEEIITGVDVVRVSGSVDNGSEIVENVSIP